MKLKNRFITLLAGGAILAIAPFSLMPVGEVVAQTSRDVMNRLSRLENEMDTLSRTVYRGEAPSDLTPMTSSGGGAASANAEVRVQQLEREIQTLTGKVEERDFEIRTLKSNFEKLSADLDLRLGDLERGRNGGQTGGNVPSTLQAPNPVPSNEGVIFNSAPEPISSQSNVLGGGTSADAAAQYYNAFSLLKAANYAGAQVQFEKFLTDYPNHSLAGNAKYWLGETHYVRQNFQAAAQQFAEGFQLYPKGAKAADNLLKLGLSLSGLNRKEEACVALDQLSGPDYQSAGPVVRRASQERARLNCS
jgi:tol-pal system protein YbgF